MEASKFYRDWRGCLKNLSTIGTDEKQKQRYGAKVGRTLKIVERNQRYRNNNSRQRVEEAEQAERSYLEE